jgi:hypothetical protein
VDAGLIALHSFAVPTGAISHGDGYKTRRAEYKRSAYFAACITVAPKIKCYLPDAIGYDPAPRWLLARMRQFDVEYAAVAGF